jgi:AcrR family transcriptional regulator
MQKIDKLPSLPDPAANRRADRQRALGDHKRNVILDAAKQVFQEHGLEGASIREIAKRAGYTPGALYFHFRSKEEIYGEILADSLERLNAAVTSAGTAAKTPRTRLRAKAIGFFSFYAQNPRDLDLGFYLFQGMKPHGLTPELNTALNKRLRDALAPIEDILGSMGVKRERALREVTSLFAHCAGLLLMQHTSRIKIFNQDATDLFNDYVDRLYERYAGN